MRFNANFAIFVICTASCSAGVIENRFLKDRGSIEKREAVRHSEDPVSYDHWPESELPGDSPPMRGLDAAEGSLLLPPNKQRRCPSFQNTPRLMTKQRRDLQTELMKRLCATCKARPQCKINNKCEQCEKWCINEKVSPNSSDDDSTRDSNDVPTVANSKKVDDAVVSLPNRFGDISSENQKAEDTAVSLQANRTQKRVYTIANFSSGFLKELICKLLGIPDTTDIDKVVVLVTTFSNQPPKFAEGFEKNVSPRAEELTKILNQKLKEAVEINQSRGKNYLTQEEMEEVAERVLAMLPSDVEKPSVNEGNLSTPFTPLKSTNLDVDTGRRINPVVSEDKFDSHQLESNENDKMSTASRFGTRHENVFDTGVIGSSATTSDDTPRQIKSEDTESPDFVVDATNLPRIGDTVDEVEVSAMAPGDLKQDNLKDPQGVDSMVGSQNLPTSRDRFEMTGPSAMELDHTLRQEQPDKSQAEDSRHIEKGIDSMIGSQKLTTSRSRLVETGLSAVEQNDMLGQKQPKEAQSLVSTGTQDFDSTIDSPNLPTSRSPPEKTGLSAEKPDGILKQEQPEEVTETQSVDSMIVSPSLPTSEGRLEKEPDDTLKQHQPEKSQAAEFVPIYSQGADSMIGSPNLPTSRSQFEKTGSSLMKSDDTLRQEQRIESQGEDSISTKIKNVESMIGSPNSPTSKSRFEKTDSFAVTPSDVLRQEQPEGVHGAESTSTESQGVDSMIVSPNSPTSKSRPEETGSFAMKPDELLRQEQPAEAEAVDSMPTQTQRVDSMIGSPNLPTSKSHLEETGSVALKPDEILREEQPEEVQNADFTATETQGVDSMIGSPNLPTFRDRFEKTESSAIKLDDMLRQEQPTEAQRADSIPTETQGVDSMIGSSDLPTFRDRFEETDSSAIKPDDMLRQEQPKEAQGEDFIPTDVTPIETQRVDSRIGLSNLPTSKDQLEKVKLVSAQPDDTLEQPTETQDVDTEIGSPSVPSTVNNNNEIPHLIGPGYIKSDKLGATTKSLLSRTDFLGQQKSENKDKVPYIDAKERYQFITKKLMQQVRDKMNERLSKSFPKIFKEWEEEPSESKLGDVETPQLKGNVLPSNKQADGMQSSIPEDNGEFQLAPNKNEPPREEFMPQVEAQEEESVDSEPVDSIEVVEGHEQFVPDSADEIKFGSTEDEDSVQRSENQGPTGDNEALGMSRGQDEAFEKDDLISDNVIVAAHEPEELQVVKEIDEPKPTPMTSRNRLKDDLSELLKKLKKRLELSPDIVDNFDKAKEALKEVQNIVNDIKHEDRIATVPITIEKATEEEMRSSLQTLSKTSGTPDSSPVVQPSVTKEQLFNKFKNTEILRSQLQETTDDGQQEDTETLGSQPMEEVIWDKHITPRIHHGTNQRRMKDNQKLGSPMISPFDGKNVEEDPSNVALAQTPPILGGTITETVPHREEHVFTAGQSDLDEMDELLQSNRNRDPGSVPSLPNHGEFPLVGRNSEKPSWSNSLGALIPSNQHHDVAPTHPKDMYFVGSGIKLPLQMVRNDNGTVQLSVDLDKLCNCKNNTSCPKNHTHLDQTILVTEAIHPNLEQKIDVDEESRSELEDRSGLRNGKETRNTWLNMKNNIARQLNPNEAYMQFEDSNVFKRSIGKVLENPPEKFALPMSNAIELANEVNNQLLQSTTGQDGMDTFKKFINDKLKDMKSIVADTERHNNEKSRQLQESEEKLMTALNTIKKSTIFANERNKINNMMEYDVKQRPLSKVKNVLSLFTDGLRYGKNGNELPDVVTSIRNPYKLSEASHLQNKLEKMNENVDQYARDTERLMKQEANTILRAQKNSFIEKEVNMMYKILNFLKTMSSNDKT